MVSKSLLLWKPRWQKETTESPGKIVATKKHHMGAACVQHKNPTAWRNYKPVRDQPQKYWHWYWNTNSRYTGYTGRSRKGCEPTSWEPNSEMLHSNHSETSWIRSLKFTDCLNSLKSNISSSLAYALIPIIMSYDIIHRSWDSEFIELSHCSVLIVSD